MREALSMIQQTLTPEAATVLNHSNIEAGRRNHSQTTPLHVAATLLASPSGFLREACIKSHRNSSHPLQCRALELCFSIALDRLQTLQNMSAGTEPPISNALMAALKRAQAHQRRVFPEQQQQPLLAVKVELEQLVISILDDPSVSRVMREAGFSSPAVKAMVEQSLNFSSSPSSVTSNSIGLGIQPKTVAPPTTNGQNLYINPRLQSGHQEVDEVKRITDILLRTSKRNPILVGESEPESVIKDLLKRIENREMQEMAFINARVIFLEKELPSDKAQIPVRLKELGDFIENRMGNSGCGGVFLNLGDLKWLVEQQPVGIGVAGSASNLQQQAFTDTGRAIVAEMTKLVAKFRDTCQLWLIGTATCETYLRCKVYHPSMEMDWDLHAVPIVARALLPQTFPRLGTNGILGVSLESLKGFPSTTMLARHENADSAPRTTMCCPQCRQSYEKEVADALKDIEKAADSMIRLEATRSSLPRWLQNARTGNEMKDRNQMVESDSHSVMMKKTQELRKKWHEVCLHLHPQFHQQNLITERIAPTPLSSMSFYNQNLLGRQSEPKLQLNKSLGCSLLLGSSERSVSPPVTTELALGQAKSGNVKDFLGCISSESRTQSNKLLDYDDSFKKLLEALTEKVWWQKDAASAIATTVTQCKIGNEKNRGVTKGNTWLLFLGPDRASKKKMAEALSEIVSGSSPITFYLGSRRGDGKTDVHLRGKTALDRIAEAIRRNPFSVISLEDIHEADLVIRSSIKRAMEQGRFCDSHGREISLGNIMFILTANEASINNEQTVANLGKGSWQLRLSIAKRTPKCRRSDWLCHKEKRFRKLQKQNASGLTFDLNEAVESDEDKRVGSMNSSELTVDHEDNKHATHNIQSPTSSTPFLPRDLLDGVDDFVVFKPIDAASIRQGFTAAVEKRFSDMVENGVCIEVQEKALGKIASGVRLSQTSLDEWIEKALAPSFKQLKRTLDAKRNDDETLVIRLEDDLAGDYGDRGYTDLLLPWVRVGVET